MAKPRTYYIREFKMAILSQIEASVPMAQVARENGIHPTLVARWKKEYLVNPEKAFAGLGHPYKDQARVAELERMVGKLYAENEFLKKNLGDHERTSRGRETEISFPERYKMIWKNQRDPYRIPVQTAADLLDVS